MKSWYSSVASTQWSFRQLNDCLNQRLEHKVWSMRQGNFHCGSFMRIKRARCEFARKEARGRSSSTLLSETSANRNDIGQKLNKARRINQVNVLTCSGLLFLSQIGRKAIRRSWCGIIAFTWAFLQSLQIPPILTQLKFSICTLIFHFLLMSKPSMLILGAGIAGSVCSFFLFHAGLRTTVIERSHPYKPQPTNRNPRCSSADHATHESQASHPFKKHKRGWSCFR